MSGILISSMSCERAARIPIHLTRSRLKSLAPQTPIFHALRFEALPDAAARPHT
jgi:hypothetical protein